MAREPRWTRYSTPAGHYSVPTVVGDRATGWRVLKQDAVDGRGRPLPSKPRADVEDTPAPRKRAARKPREDTPTATPTPTNSEESE